jgi:hypothetical protein
MAHELQLTAAAAAGSKGSFLQIKPDGSQATFSIPRGKEFVATDLSIQRERVVSSVGLFDVSITQDPGNLHQLRWAFVGSMSQNFERSFTTGIAFSTPFQLENGTPSADAVVVRLWGVIRAKSR